MRLFVSYAHVDRRQVEKLVNLLQRAGHEPWFDHRLLPGDDWKKELLGAVTSCDAFVYAISPASLASDWCQWEFAQAVALSKPVLPVVIQKIPSLPPPLNEIQYVELPKRPSNEEVAKLMGGLHKLASVIPRDKAPSAPEKPKGTPAQAESKSTTEPGQESPEPPGCNLLKRIPWKDLPPTIWVALITVIGGVIGAILGCIGSVLSALITVVVPMLMATAAPTPTTTSVPPTFADTPSATSTLTATYASATPTLTPTLTPSHTQITEVAIVQVPMTSPEITLALMVENESFILYVTAKEAVFVGGMQFRVVDSQNHIQTVNIQQIFPQQLALKGYFVQPGECYVYREINVTPGVPSDCSEIFHEPVIRAEIFWYNFQRNERYPIQVLRNGQEVRLCDTQNPFCEIPYPTGVPPTPAVTPATPTETPTATATTTIPTATDTPPTPEAPTDVPSATPRPIMCGASPIDCQPITNGEFNEFAEAVHMDDWSPTSDTFAVVQIYSQARAFCEYHDAHVTTQEEWENAKTTVGFDPASLWQEWTSTTQVDNGITLYVILTKGNPEIRLSADANPANIKRGVMLTFRCARDP